MKEFGNPERNQKDNLKCMIAFSAYLQDKPLDKVNDKETKLAVFEIKKSIQHVLRFDVIINRHLYCM
jgi:hypothetical protein